MYQRVSRERVTVMTGRSGPVCGAEAMLCALWSCVVKPLVRGLSSLKHEIQRRLAWRLYLASSRTRHYSLYSHTFTQHTVPQMPRNARHVHIHTLPQTHAQARVTCWGSSQLVRYRVAC